VEDDQFELQQSSASHSSTANQGPAKKGSVDNGPVDSVHIDGVDSVHNGPVDSVHIDGVDSVHFDGVYSGNFDPVDQDGTVDMSTVASVVAESTASVGLPTKRSVEVSMGSEWPMTLCKSCPSHGVGKATQASETETLINLTGDEESPEPSRHQPLRLAKALGLAVPAGMVPVDEISLTPSQPSQDDARGTLADDHTPEGASQEDLEAELSEKKRQREIAALSQDSSYKPDEDDEDEDYDDDYDLDDEDSDVVVLDTTAFLEKDDKARRRQQNNAVDANPWEDPSLSEEVDEDEVIRRHNFEKRDTRIGGERRSIVNYPPSQVDPDHEHAYLHRVPKPDFAKLHC
jgi:hypothetical protein